jgi:hypothetical protein
MKRATTLLAATLLTAAFTGSALAANQAAAAAATTGAAKTRDWQAIDTNKDHYISPSEMQAYLNKVWHESKQG